MRKNEKKCIKTAYFINMHIPVVSIARLIPFHEAIIEYFCLAVNGNLGSGAAGGGGSHGPIVLSPSALELVANFPSSQPILNFFYSSFI